MDRVTRVAEEGAVLKSAFESSTKEGPPWRMRADVALPMNEMSYHLY